jgi:hypothetical protein
VLNHELFFRGYSKYPRKTIKRPLDQIDQGSVEILNDLITQTGAKVVISSTWRILYTQEEIQGFLNHFGFIGEVVGMTPRYTNNHSVRGNEILGWIKENKSLISKDYYDFNEYVIFDDDTDFLLWQKDNFIHIDRYCGITPTNIFKAEKILNKKKDVINEGI